MLDGGSAIEDETPAVRVTLASGYTGSVAEGPRQAPASRRGAASHRSIAASRMVSSTMGLVM